MRNDDWLPVSAASLVAGAMALLLATVLTTDGATTQDMFRTVQAQGGRWLGGAFMYFLASVGLILGLPAIIVLVQGRGRRTAMAACVVLAVGYLGTAGYAALLIFFRALVVTEALTATALEAAAEENGLMTFVFAWVGAFYLGELLLAIALWRAGTDVIARWVPIALLGHVVSLAFVAGPARGAALVWARDQGGTAVVELLDGSFPSKWLRPMLNQPENLVRSFAQPNQGAG
jgi:hypothetical protein